MSKIGKQIITLPEGVTVEIEDGSLIISGSLGKITKKFRPEVKFKLVGNQLAVEVSGTSKKHLSLWGTSRKIASNAVLGVSQGWSKQLELVGTGYRAEVRGKLLVLTVGYSHPIEIEAPEQITFKVEKNIITVSGIDREIVGQVAANVRGSRPPEPYKGKGVKYIDEVIRRKAGKAAKTAAA